MMPTPTIEFHEKPLICKTCGLEIPPPSLACKPCLENAGRKDKIVEMFRNIRDADFYTYGDAIHVHMRGRGALRQRPKENAICGAFPRWYETPALAARGLVKNYRQGLCQKCAEVGQSL
jgi:hypothetical protein